AWPGSLSPPPTAPSDGPDPDGTQAVGVPASVGDEQTGVFVIGFLRERLPHSRQYALTGVVILVLLACLGFSGRAIGRSVRAEYSFRAALKALERKDFAAAREHLTRCLEARPGNGEAHFLAGRTARRALDYEEAERQIREYQKLG